MSSKRSSVIEIPEFVAGDPKASHPKFNGRIAEDDAINALSKRLWMLEIHRRLETEARHTLAPDDRLHL